MRKRDTAARSQHDGGDAGSVERDDDGFSRLLLRVALHVLRHVVTDCARLLVRHTGAREVRAPSSTTSDGSRIESIRAVRTRDLLRFASADAATYLRAFDKNAVRQASTETP